MIAPAQCRAARALLGWHQTTLAERSGVSTVTIQNFEGGKSDPYPGTMVLLERAFEAAGVEFIPEDNGGAGVRLRKGTKK